MESLISVHLLNMVLLYCLHYDLFCSWHSFTELSWNHVAVHKIIIMKNLDHDGPASLWPSQIVNVRSEAEVPNETHEFPPLVERRVRKPRRLCIWGKRSHAWMDGWERASERQAATLGRVLVGALSPGGCSHTRLFVVFVLRREEGYFPEPGRRISVAWPPSPAAHMISNAGKPPKMAQGEVRRGWWELHGREHQPVPILQSVVSPAPPLNN